MDSNGNDNPQPANFDFGFIESIGLFLANCLGIILPHFFRNTKQVTAFLFFQHFSSGVICAIGYTLLSNSLVYSFGRSSTTSAVRANNHILYYWMLGMSSTFLFDLFNYACFTVANLFRPFHGGEGQSLVHRGEQSTCCILPSLLAAKVQLRVEFLDFFTPILMNEESVPFSVRQGASIVKNQRNVHMHLAFSNFFLVGKIVCENLVIGLTLGILKEKMRLLISIALVLRFFVFETLLVTFIESLPLSSSSTGSSSSMEKKYFVLFIVYIATPALFVALGRMSDLSEDRLSNDDKNLLVSVSSGILLSHGLVELCSEELLQGKHRALKYLLFMLGSGLVITTLSDLQSYF